MHLFFTWWQCFPAEYRVKSMSIAEIGPVLHTMWQCGEVKPFGCLKLHQFSRIVWNMHVVTCLPCTGCVCDCDFAIHSDICFPDPCCDSWWLLWWHQTLHFAGVGSADHFWGMRCLLPPQFGTEQGATWSWCFKYFIYSTAKIFFKLISDLDLTYQQFEMFKIMSCLLNLQGLTTWRQVFFC